LLGAAVMNLHRFASVLCVTLCLGSLAALSGCSSSSSSSDNDAPVVDALDVPSTATIGASGHYQIQGTISAHDPDGVIHEILLEIPGYTSPSITIDQQTITAKAFLVQIDGRSPKGPLTATAKIVDDQGASTSRAVTITLQ
jgi:hypothetical protein